MKHEIGTNLNGPDAWLRVFLPPETPTSLCASLDEAPRLSTLLQSLKNPDIIRELRDNIKGLSGLGPVTVTAVVSIPLGRSREKVWKAKVEAEPQAIIADLSHILKQSAVVPAKPRPFADGQMPCSRTGMVSALIACGVPVKGWHAILLDDMTGMAEVVFNEDGDQNAQPLLSALYRAKATYETHYKRGAHLLTVAVNCRECEEAGNG